MHASHLLNEVLQGCEVLVKVCADLKAHEKVIVVSDENTKEIGELITSVASEISSQVGHRIIKPLLFHGEEPSEDIVAQFLNSDVIFCLTKMSLAHTKARYMASKNGARYLSLPDYSMALLSRPALKVNFKNLTLQADRLAELFSTGQEVVVRSLQGTNLLLHINGRQGNSYPGWCNNPGSMASPPDAETNIAPIENLSEGVVIVDGSIPCKEIGLLKSPVALFIAGGKIVQIEGAAANKLENIFNRVKHPGARILAELGIGLNPKAELCGIMLEDEGCLGTVHLGFGSNSTIGGQNSVPFHLDMVIRNATLKIDGQDINWYEH